MDKPVFYGELAVIGLNGSLPGSEKSSRRFSKISLYKRPKPNGVRPGLVNQVLDPRDSLAVKSPNTHAVSFTVSRQVTYVVEYVPDPKVDMFQIGRSTDNHIDFIVSEPRSSSPDRTQPPTDSKSKHKSTDSGKRSGGTHESAVSRFACRIHIDRDPPHKARLYAAGFDASNNIFLGERAIKWKCGSSMDGLTTNGVMMLRLDPSQVLDKPNPGETGDGSENIRNKPSEAETDPQIPLNWREVSVCGAVYEMRSRRCVPNETNRVNEDNLLSDMTMIDLCGVTLLWRSRTGLRHTASPEDLENMIEGLNQARFQCPVLYRTLQIPRNQKIPKPNQKHNPESDRVPYVYLNCGHVHGWHNWRSANDVDDGSRTCPLCLQPSAFVPLRMGMESAFYVDRNLATHCFNPCGHIASKNTVQYWCSIRLPNRHNFELHARCPFCLVPIKPNPVRLLFQNDMQGEALLQSLTEHLCLTTLSLEAYASSQSNSSTVSDVEDEVECRRALIQATHEGHDQKQRSLCNENVQYNY